MKSRKKPPMTPNDERHGTPTGYQAGCRDRCCRTAASRQRTMLRRKARARGLAPDDPRHGTNNAYTNLACRCAPCRKAASAVKYGQPEQSEDATAA
jgi:hypothetical protein